MEIQSYEFTVEDILNIHRSWITELYVVDRKTPVEIVGLLGERRLLVSVSQINLCIREWNLVPLDQATTTSTSTSSRAVSNSRASPGTFNEQVSTTDPETRVMYENRPLPSLPPQATPGPSRHEDTFEDHYTANFSAPKRRHMATSETPPLELDSTVQTIVESLNHQLQQHNDEGLSDSLSPIAIGHHRRARDVQEGSVRKFTPTRRVKRRGEAGGEGTKKNNDE